MPGPVPDGQFRCEPHILTSRESLGKGMNCAVSDDVSVWGSLVAPSFCSGGVCAQKQQTTIAQYLVQSISVC